MENFKCHCNANSMAQIDHPGMLFQFKRESLTSHNNHVWHTSSLCWHSMRPGQVRELVESNQMKWNKGKCGGLDHNRLEANLLEKLKKLSLFSLEKMEWRPDQYMQISSGQVAREWGHVLFSDAHWQDKRQHEQTEIQFVMWVSVIQIWMYLNIFRIWRGTNLLWRW